MSDPITDPNPNPATDPNPNPAPNTDPNPNPAPDDPHKNDPHKYRRLFEKTEQRLKEVEAELKKRTDAELSEIEREKADRTAAEERATKAEQRLLRLEIAQETGLSAEAIEMLNGTDADSLREQATKLAGMMPKAEAPPAGGTHTQPPKHGGPSVDEQIAAAEKAGNHILAISLKRQKAGLA